MESGRSIYYQENTVIAPHPSAGNLAKRVGEVGQLAPGQDGMKIMTYEAKVCATLQCVWCHFNFEDYRVVCLRCNNCQYCGFLTNAFDECVHCGNKLPDELRTDWENRTIMVA